MLAASYHDSGVKALRAAVEVLLRGGAAVDAVELGIAAVEDDPDERTVGLSGWPDWIGEVTLDAGIMDGSTLRACGVAAVRRVKHPISLARKCLELLPHSLIVGEPAVKLAEHLGLELAEKPQPPPEAVEKKRGLERGITEGSAQLLSYYSRIFRLASRIWHDTIGVIAVDRCGNIAAGASTSGIAFKFPGRVADSAVVGAGFYSDSRYGAAICTGVGEVAMRTAAAFRAVMLLSQGYDPSEAANLVIEAAAEVAKLDGEKYSLGIVVASREIVSAAALNWENFKYVYWLGNNIEVRIADNLRHKYTHGA